MWTLRQTTILGMAILLVARTAQAAITPQTSVVYELRNGAAAFGKQQGKATPPSTKKALPPKKKPARPPATKSRATISTRKNAAKTTGPHVSGGTATIPNEIFNLIKAIVGVGVLSLPAGIAAFGNSPSAVIPSVVLVTIMGTLSGYGFATIGKVCAYTGATSYRDAWTRSVGAASSWIPGWSTILKTGLTCLAVSMVLADTFCSLLGTTSRTQVLVSLTVLILLPLCWLKNLSSLAPFSLLGVMGMMYTGLAMTKRLLDGSYGEGGKLVEYLPDRLRPSFGDDGWESVFRPNSLILLCMLSTAFMAHFNAPKFYNELKNNTLQRYNTVVGTSYGVSILIMVAITAVGFLTFGASCSGLVLNNYATQDLWMSASRIAVAVSLVFSYPLAFQGCRDGILDLCKVPLEQRTVTRLNLTTILMLTAITAAAAVMKDLSLVLALGGATLGNALAYIYPAIMYGATVSKLQLKGETLGLIISYTAALLGLVMGAIGTKIALEK